MPALKPELEAAIPTELVDALRDRKALALVGAGLSRGLDFPDWSGLLSELAGAILTEKYEREERDRLLAKCSSNPEWVAEVLKHRSMDMYVSKLRDRFDLYQAPRFSLAHALLATLPFAGYLTTNYDHLVEDYVEVVDITSPGVVTPFQQENPSSVLRRPGRFVIKLHGCARRDSGRLVLSSTDYFEIMRKPQYERLLASLFQRFTIVTVGFGLADRDLMRFIEERRHLYGNMVPTVFALVSSAQITRSEVDTYRTAYNVVPVQFSPERNYAQLTELLMSLYCLVHQADSQTVSPEIESLALRSYQNMPFVVTTESREPASDIVELQRILSVFQEPIPTVRLSSWLAGDRHRIGTAQLRMLSTSTADGRLQVRERRSPDGAALTKVGKWIRSEIASTSTEMTSHDKTVLFGLSKTIASLLETEDGVRALLDHEGARGVFDRLSQYHKQAGRWKQWQAAVAYMEGVLGTSEYRPALAPKIALDKIWLFYWQARYDEARATLDASRDVLAGESKAHVYDLRLRFRLAKTVDEIRSVEDKVAQLAPSTGDTSSLAGQIAFELWRRTSEDRHRDRSIECFKDAIARAKDGKLAEIAVYNYYLACAYAEYRRLDLAREALSEVHRIDTAMLRRVPGMAWQRVAEYRLAFATGADAAPSLRSNAIDALADLGVTSPETFVDTSFI